MVITTHSHEGVYMQVRVSITIQPIELQGLSGSQKDSIQDGNVKGTLPVIHKHR